ncbi:MAG: UDP-glucose/GDP-mannose dehydrogenase family protein [Myxococcales bacterium]|nr:UDP-glucose/GDP-mannose dehydrogenase family protein [Myxococcales bacterium]
MKLSMVGTGYVGLVAGTCFADAGNHVICVDVDETKIDALKRGEVPIYEPGLGEILQRNLKAGRLIFTTDLAEAVAGSLVVFVAVGTPEASDGSADLSAVLSVAEQIGRHMDGYRIVVTKSTVPVGTHKRIAATIRAQTHHRFDVVSNPEFMKEGAAVDDFTRPDRVILGTDNPAVVEIMRQIYSPFMRKRERVLSMDPASAEMTKYASNALLATRVSFMNEVANLCERYGANAETVRLGVGSDSRIGHSFLFPGVGYGGSCFPKDVSAFISMGKGVGYSTDITLATQEINRRQRRAFAERVIDHFGDRAASTTLAVWGLAFKSRTDDVREAPAIDAIRMFVERGMKIRGHDPQAMANARAALRTDAVTYCEDGYEALDQADALVIFTDWPEFQTPDFEGILRRLRRPVVFDGRNLYEPAFMARLGFEYHSIGRRTVPARESQRPD